MNDFDEKFPSIKEYDIWIPSGISDSQIDLETVYHKCLDKQKVKDAITKNYDTLPESAYHKCQEILKELGL